MKKLYLIFIFLVLTINIYASEEVKIKATEDSVADIFSIMKSGNGSAFCIPGNSTLLEVVKNIEGNAQQKFGTTTLTTKQMTGSFKELYPCKKI